MTQAARLQRGIGLSMYRRLIATARILRDEPLLIIVLVLWRVVWPLVRRFGGE